MTSGRIDVHSHLLPGIDDGCKTQQQSLQCARALVAAGYSHCICTPHIWPSLPQNTPETIRADVLRLQKYLDAQKVPLRLAPGGEISLPTMWPQLQSLPDAAIVTYALAGKFALFDFWEEQLEQCTALEAPIKHLQSRGLTLILAHPERIAILQNDASAIDWLTNMGVLLQLNSWCLCDPPESANYVTAMKLLKEDRYFLMGTDLHRPEGMDVRMRGVQVASQIVGADVVDRLTIHNPRKLLPAGA